MPALPDQEDRDLRINLIKEEFEELLVAFDTDDLIESIDALVDLLYVTYGALDVLGVDGDMAFEEVHSSNLSKLSAEGKVIKREDGKILKGPNFREPDLLKVLQKQISKNNF